MMRFSACDSEMGFLFIFDKNSVPYGNEFDRVLREYHSEDIMSLNHSKLIHRLSVALDRYENAFDILPELELALTTGKCKPDVAIYQNMPIDWLNDVVFYNQPPIVAVEILSPKQALTDLTDKAYKQYFPAGVQVVWLVIPTTRIVQTLLPTGAIQTWVNGIMKDSITGMEIDLGYLFNKMWAGLRTHPHERKTAS